MKKNRFRSDSWNAPYPNPDSGLDFGLYLDTKKNPKLKKVWILDVLKKRILDSESGFLALSIILDLQLCKLHLKSAK